MSDHTNLVDLPSKDLSDSERILALELAVRQMAKVVTSMSNDVRALTSMTVTGKTVLWTLTKVGAAAIGLFAAAVYIIEHFPIFLLPR